VASFCQLLARRYQGRLDKEADEYIAFAVDGAKRMEQLISDLLDYSRAGRTAEQLTDVDCGEVVRRVCLDLGAAIADAGAVVTVAGELPVVRANMAPLVQLFGNLVSNAVKFRGDRPPRVEVSAVRDGTGWLFAVADNGIGIDPQYADQIFAIFQRLHARFEYPYPGTGIGLALCKKIVESYGGKIWFESRRGEGTTFCWTMPAREEAAP